MISLISCCVPRLHRKIPDRKFVIWSVNFNIASRAIEDSRLAFERRTRRNIADLNELYVVMAQLLPTRWSPTVTILMDWWAVGSISMNIKIIIIIKDSNQRQLRATILNLDEWEVQWIGWYIYWVFLHENNIDYREMITGQVTSDFSL